MPVEERRLPAPWTIEDTNGACYVIRDSNGFAISFVYYEIEPGRRAAANLMTKDEGKANRNRHRQSPGFVEAVTRR
jgi:hypothetical protein